MATVKSHPLRVRGLKHEELIGRSDVLLSRILYGCVD